MESNNRKKASTKKKPTAPETSDESVSVVMLNDEGGVEHKIKCRNLKVAGKLIKLDKCMNEMSTEDIAKMMHYMQSNTPMDKVDETTKAHLDKMRKALGN